MCAVGSAEGVGRLAPQLVGDGLEVARWHYDVGVEHDEPFAACALGAVVAAGAWAGVLLCEVLHVHACGPFPGHGAAVALGAVFDYYHLEVFHRLGVEAFEQFFHFVGAVVNGYDEREPAL